MPVFNDTTIGALEFSIAWEKDGVRHEDWYLGRKFNPVNDIFPRDMRDALEGKGAGESVTLTYKPHYCIPRHKDSLVITRTMDRLRKKTVKGRPIVPRLGRFYPQGHINGLPDIYPDTLTPFRLIGLTEDEFIADRNHPLAKIPVTITARIQYVEKRDTGTYGSLTHWRETTCDWGPGMQTMFDGQPTDFFEDGFFDRGECTDTPFTPPPVDGKAERNMDAIFERHLKPGMRVLDVTPYTPLPEGRFDAATCRLGVEYMPDPCCAFEALAGRLEPGSPVIVGFTNHYHPTRVINGWTQLHEFERSGLVLEYLRRAGLDGDARTYSMRNDWRDKDDLRFLETKGVSDPVFVVVGHKK